VLKGRLKVAKATEQMNICLMQEGPMMSKVRRPLAILDFGHSNEAYCDGPGLTVMDCRMS
jgi:hypothetical protein